MKTLERQKKYAKMLGKQIRAIRKAKGLTQVELAERAHMNGTYVGDVERGDETISIKNLIFLSDALEVHHSELLNSLDDQECFPRGELLVSLQNDLHKLEEENLACLRSWMDYILANKKKAKQIK